MTVAIETNAEPRLPVVDVRGLSLAIRGRTILDRVSFDVRRGEVLTLIGPNGAGKTTLLECMLGLRRADAGVVRRDACTLSSWRDRAETFAYMPDDAELPAELTVSHVLDHARRLARAPADLVRALTTRLDLSTLGSARAGELSRGERRRVGLFQALCTSCPVIVLDEPFGAFDPLQLRSILELVRERASTGTAIVASVHQMADAEKIADRVLILASGRVVAFGSPDELRARAAAAKQGGRNPPRTLEDIFVACIETEPRP